MNPDAEQWLLLAEHDLRAAEALVAGGEYSWAQFCCQQAVEKTLKGVIVERTGSAPPRTHDLVKLAGQSGVELSSDDETLLGDLTIAYTESRYTISEEGQEATRSLLEATKRLCEWIRRKIQQ